ncbi:disease resistance protein TAO1 isoform X1 [Cryptomeria japonica]|uniref:disease resistance protein TAO1 isoform X1 n=1 Tax=Cryptomeria japonica TaxID=3369 RepID=UPI0027DA4BBA|nr:disease resistance protein TAO1 isoform X1 [Cryptomeria japonica]XP_057831142.2 disease resistance protein TAO1 isoform X1 [Cryptomeria japonica]XP_057831151.2 disease resistance protein TAO1 isoform X1 [Cryptomeria japonica]XP_057831158.2 disease resistance protein TAO1 isoform X1 [Cryptomeria japonica]XP_057831167.2 disease resistance protein TAO1 isoform X1 [Cryptomeria japonica]
MSLKVFGAQLYGISNKDYWEPQLNKISRILDEDIKEKLKMRCDALDNEEKQMFLDCACFFIGDKKTSAIVTWDGSGWSGLHGWERLLSKCLVELDDYVCIRMHDHLKDLGREIAIQQSPYRLWSPQQSPQQIIIADNEAQRIVIRGIMAITAGSTIEVEFPRCSQGGELIVNTSRGEDCGLTPNSLGLKFFQVTGNYYNQVIGDKSRELVWLRWFHHGQRNLHSLSSLKNLRVLELNEELWANKHHLEELWQTDSTGPVLLRELVIYGCSKVEGFPKSIGCLINLKKIVLSYGSKMKSLPESFCLFQSLEHLELLVCVKLSSLPSSFGNLRNLRHLDLSGCTELSVLPDSFKKLILLGHLCLEGCSTLTLESNLFVNITKIEYLNLEGCMLKVFPRHITNQVNLTVLSVDGTSGLREIPTNISQPGKLQKFYVGSELLTSLPTTLGDFSCLTALRILINTPS